MTSSSSKRKPFLLNRKKLRKAFCYSHPAHTLVSGNWAQVALECAQSVVKILLYPYVTSTRREHAETCPICTPRECIRRLPRHRRALSDPPFEMEKPSTTAITPAILRLPYDLRHAIFASLLGDGKVIHIHSPLSRKLDYLSHRIFPSADEPPHNWGLLAVGEIANTPKLPAGIALLQTCRQIYNECMYLLYTANLFDFNRAMEYLMFTKSVRAGRLAMIRHLQISREDSDNPYEDGSKFTRTLPGGVNLWEKMWLTVGQEMKGLRTLKIRLYYDEYNRGDLTTAPRTYAEDVLRSMRKNVRGLERFSLEVTTPAFDIRELEGEIRREVCSERVSV